MVHELKSWPENFARLTNSTYTWDLRKADRDFKVGDMVVFKEWNHQTGGFTGQWNTRKITFITRDFTGLVSGYCILSLI